MTVLYGGPFQYKTFNLLNMGEIETLPFTGVTFGRGPINQPGAWNGNLQISDPRVQALDWRQGSGPGTAALFVEYYGRLIWGGPIWTRRYQRSTGRLVVGASEFGSYLKQRLQAEDYNTTWAAGADPMKIAQRVVEDAFAAGSIAGGITLVLNPAGEGGPTVAPSYPGTSVQTIESIVSLLAQMGYSFGFDYSFDVAYQPGTTTPQVTMSFWYPRQGRPQSQTNLVVLVKNTLDYTYDEDATQAANRILEAGSGQNLEPVQASAVIPGYPLLERVVSRTQVTDEGQLANIALGDLGLYCYPPVTPSLTMPVPMPRADGTPDPGPLTFGDFDLGDDLKFVIDPVATNAENSDPRFPEGASFDWRVNAWSCQPEGKPPQYKLDLMIPPLQTVPPPQPPI